METKEVKMVKKAITEKYGLKKLMVKYAEPGIMYIIKSGTDKFKAVINKAKCSIIKQ